MNNETDEEIKELYDKWFEDIKARDKAVGDVSRPIEERLYVVERDNAMVMWYFDRLLKILRNKKE